MGTVPALPVREKETTHAQTDMRRARNEALSGTTLDAISVSALRVTCRARDLVLTLRCALDWASSDPSRPHLGGVLLIADYKTLTVVGTNGHGLFRGDIDTSTDPTIDGHTFGGKESMHITAATAHAVIALLDGPSKSGERELSRAQQKLAAAQKKAKGQACQPIERVDPAVIARTTCLVEGGRIGMMNGSGKMSDSSAEIRIMDPRDAFPRSWLQSIPNQPPTGVPYIGISARYVEMIGKTFGRAERGKYQDCFALSFRGELEPIEASGHLTDTAAATVIFMPCRL